MSDDRRLGVVVIAFVGSVFSPYYFAERARSGCADPMDFCAFNVAVYEGRKRVWGFTEWPRSQVERNSEGICLGPNRIASEDGRITIRIRETRVSGNGRIEGMITIHPEQRFDHAFLIDAMGFHRWHPVAPVARIEVALKSPALRFRGSGYHDANEGDEPLEKSLRGWTWSRHAVGRDTVVLYDGVERDDSTFSLAMRFGADGAIDAVTPPPMVKLRRTFFWRCPRSTRSEGPGPPRVVRTLEDSPFYARTLIACNLFGESTPGMHESLSLDRFTSGAMQWMLPYRTRRAP